MAKKKALALYHVDFEKLGTLEDVLQARGFEIDYVHACTADLTTLDPVTPDLFVVLGGPMGVYEQGTYPFINQEVALLKKRFASDRPTLGICLGAQIIAHTLGASVYPGPAKEIGWKPLTLTPEGQVPFFQCLSPRLTSMFHWHGDTFDLPPGAVRLASTDICQNQAFRLGKNILGFQFHPELRMTDIGKWTEGHKAELESAKIDPSKIKQDTATFGPALEIQGRACLDGWLEQL